MDLDVLAELLQLRLELPRRLGGEVLVLSPRSARGLRADIFEKSGCCVGPGDQPVERDTSGHGVGASGGENEGEAPTHTEPDHTHMAPEDLRGNSSTAPLMSLVASGIRRAIISLPASSGSVVFFPGKVRGKGHEALGGEAVADIGDVRDEPPPLLDHDDAGPSTPFRECEVAARRAAVDRGIRSNRPCDWTLHGPAPRWPTEWPTSST